VNTVTTNVPGPQVPLYACGCKMLDYFPFVPLAQGVRTGVAIVTYNGNVFFGVTGDWETMPDLQVLSHGIEAGMHELLDLVHQQERRRPSSKAAARPRGDTRRPHVVEKVGDARRQPLRRDPKLQQRSS
jgi:hypothetical protein